MAFILVGLFEIGEAIVVGVESALAVGEVAGVATTATELAEIGAIIEDTAMTAEELALFGEETAVVAEEAGAVAEEAGAVAEEAGADTGGGLTQFLEETEVVEPPSGIDFPEGNALGEASNFNFTEEEM